MSCPQLSIIIPTHNRPHLLPKAVASALAQTYRSVEVVVIDDASKPAVQLPEHPQLKVVRLEQGRGGAGARNVGTQLARGRWVTYLDDDDSLLPHMAEACLSALQAASNVDSPVAAISGIRKVNEHGEVLSTRIPPARCPRGGYFFLEPSTPGSSYHTKQTLVVERDTILQIGGWDESFRSRVHSELFLRLNPACTLIGLPVVTYHLLSHTDARVSGNPDLRQESFYRLVEKHRDVFEARPEMFSHFVYKHAVTTYEMGQKRLACRHLARAIALSPGHMLATAARTATSGLKQRLARRSNLGAFLQRSN